MKAPKAERPTIRAAKVSRLVSLCKPAVVVFCSIPVSPLPLFVVRTFLGHDLIPETE